VKADDESKEKSSLWCALEKPGGGKPDSRRRTGGGGKPGGGPGMPGKDVLMAACEGKEEKDTCEVTMPANLQRAEKTMTGTCAPVKADDESKEKSSLWCALEKPGGGKPASRRRTARRRTGGGGKPGGGPGMPGKELLMKACEDKEEKDTCEVPDRS
jgi:hypothetical protein